MANKNPPKPGAESGVLKSLNTNTAKSPNVMKVAAANPQTMIRRKEMVERIVAASGQKPNVVKSVLDGMLGELGNALSAGEGLNLHPLGKVTVIRQKQLGDKEVLTCKIRRKLPQEQAPLPIDTAAE